LIAIYIVYVDPPCRLSGVGSELETHLIAAGIKPYVVRRGSGPVLAGPGRVVVDVEIIEPLFSIVFQVDPCQITRRAGINAR
jgi:hypothetical protein